ncbi:hypothetical protein RS030_4503 [Cryptosporidium xiaoi]|uniref:COG complex component COG2 C-terminal domain-containing protein n=1 Tax=Cryptosporidium xiaoi TaxID=659607 RepID=A0AAV9XV79_9CRYT
MLEKFILNKKPPKIPYIASCIEFKERQEFCRVHLIPLLLKRNKNCHNTTNEKIITKEETNVKSKRALFNKNDTNLRALINKIRNEAINEYIKINKKSKNTDKIEFKLIIDKVRKIITNNKNELKSRIIELENKIEDYKLKYIENIIFNGKNTDLLTVEINQLLCKISKLNFTGDSIIEKIDKNQIEKYRILNIIYENIHDFDILISRLEEIYDKLNNNRIKCSEVYDIIITLSEYVNYYYNNENNIVNINIGNILHRKILKITYFIENLLSKKCLDILRLYCNWGKIDKIIEEFLSKRNTAYSINDLVNNNIHLIEIEKKEKMANSLGILLVLFFECNNIYKNNNNNKLLYKNTTNKIISYLCNEMMSTLKSLFFSKNSLLSNIDKPEWFLQISLSIFKSHYYYLNELWKKFDDNIKKELYLLEKYKFKDENKICNNNIKSNFIPYYVPKNKYISLINEILLIEPKEALSISILNELRSVIKIYIKKILLFKDGNVIRDNKSDYLFEKLIEQILIQYKYWKEIDEYNCNILLLDLLTNMNVKDLLSVNKINEHRYLFNDNVNEREMNSNVEINLNLDDDYRVVNVEDITKTAVNLAKIAFSVVMKDQNEKYLDIFKEGKPSEFPLECGILNWFCIINKIYIKNQISRYLSDSIVLCYTDKFNIKRTNKDLFETICNHSGSSDKNIVLRWFSDTIIYMTNDMGNNMQPLITPIKSINDNKDVVTNNDNLILILGYSIETIELLNAFSGKISIFIESCLSIEDIRNNRNLTDRNKDRYNECYCMNNYLNKSINNDCNPSIIFMNEFFIPIIDNCMLGEFINYVNFEWNRIGHKIGPFLPISSILIESLNLVLSALVNLNDAICVSKNSDADNKNENYILSYKNCISNLKKIKNDMINDVKFEIREVLIKPLLFGEVKIPSLDDLINSKTNDNLSSSFFDGNAKLLFDEHLSSKANELKYSFKLFSIFLSNSCLDEISKVLNE